MPHIINYLTKIQFGESAIAELANELQLLKIKRPLFVTDKGLSATLLSHTLLSLLSLMMAHVFSMIRRPTLRK